uniref:1-alkyl-2-acetylglycerophosphocholine esterase n=1 Tax=Ciona intestinalis TaxID=7719 RepID=F6V1U5_CIOIN|nr:platelet-activating factor acetylhydrolase IB subunit beta-like [Ciona intestinalis]|eukprot:XP_002130784.1 platelet-activating factor acetylhydrolase IB subunit beta-like [Ciona intestinalis]
MTQMNDINVNSAVVPAPVIDMQGDGRWNSQHRIFCEQGQNKDVDILVLGDSMCRLMYNSSAWSNLKPYRCLNFGIGGDKTQNILWRLQNGELDSVTARYVVIWCGTNNVDNSASEIAEGVNAVINYVRQKLNCFVLMLGIAPRGERPNPLRSKMEEANSIIKRNIQDMSKVSYLDVGNQFLGENGILSNLDFYDFLHPTPMCYEKILSAILKQIEAFESSS